MAENMCKIVTRFQKSWSNLFLSFFSWCHNFQFLHFYLSFLECNKIKLVGPSRCSGRVEIYHRDSWGTVCDDHWSVANADVVCRELNCGTVLEAKKSAFFGEGKENIWLDDVQCTGHETSILKCQHRPLSENNCGHSEDAGVVCSGKTYLGYVRST